MRYTLQQHLVSVLSNPKKLVALYVVDAACWVAVGAAAMFFASKFGGF